MDAFSEMEWKQNVPAGLRALSKPIRVDGESYGNAYNTSPRSSVRRMCMRLELVKVALMMLHRHLTAGVPRRYGTRVTPAA